MRTETNGPSECRRFDLAQRSSALVTRHPEVGGATTGQILPHGEVAIWNFRRFGTRILSTSRLPASNLLERRLWLVTYQGGGPCSCDVGST